MAQSAPAAPTVELERGITSVAFSPVLLNAAAALHITIDDIWPAVIIKGVGFFPILDGAVDVADAKGEIIHGGGLSLTRGATVVTLTDFIIDTTLPQPILSGLVTANGSVVARVPLFNLALPALSLPLTPDRCGKVVIRDVGVTLTVKAAAALNGVFDVTAFAGGLPIGTAVVKTRVGNPLR